jgi:hypothetical protein
MFAIAGLVVLLYQVWIHTEHVGKLGWFDRIFSSPSNHRVHHAVNDAYIDKNYGGMLIIWDRIFGTFAEEGEEKCVYGTRPQLNSWDPVRANLVVYWKLLKGAWHAKRWQDRLRIWFMPPGWAPEGESAPERFDPSKVATYDPPMKKPVLLFGCVQFFLLLGASAAFLWYMDELPFRVSAVFVACILAGLWATGLCMQGSMSIGRALFVDALAIFAALLVAS